MRNILYPLQTVVVAFIAGAFFGSVLEALIWYAHG